MYNKSDSRIIIIGGSGLIGGSLNNILLKDGCKVISTYAKNPFPKAVRFDFTKDKLSQISEKFNSKDIFVILSAYSNPSWIAENKDQTFNLNVRSTINLINQISDIGAKIFFMSSVVIFDGSSEFNLENTKPVITKNKKALLANQIYSLLKKKVKKNIKKGDPINLSSV